MTGERGRWGSFGGEETEMVEEKYIWKKAVLLKALKKIGLK